MEKMFPIHDLSSKAVYTGKRTVLLHLGQGEVLYLVRINHRKGFRVYIICQVIYLYTHMHMHICVELLWG